jgi:hypothetical protein
MAVLVLGHYTGLHRRKRPARTTLGIDLDAVRREAVANGMSPEQVEAALRQVVAEGDRIDSKTRTRAALALAKEMVTEDLFGVGHGGDRQGG